MALTETCVTLDSTPITLTAFVRIRANWKVAQVPVGNGVHHVDATAPVDVIAYGYNNDVSYAYMASMVMVI